MSSSDIRSAWNTGIFQDATILSITNKAAQYDITASVKSGVEVLGLYYQERINFFKQVVTRVAKNNLIRGNNPVAARYEYEVEVTYNLEKDIAQADQNYNTAIDRLEVLDDLVRTNLGATWSNTVDYWEVTGILKPQLTLLDEREVWVCGYSYLAVETV